MIRVRVREQGGAGSPAFKASAAWGRARRVPFTLVLVFALLTTGVVSGTIAHPLSRSPLLKTVGVGWAPLAQGRYWTLLTSLFFGLEPYMYGTIALVILLFVAPFEYRFGTLRTAAVFLVTHMASTLAAVVGLHALASAGWPLAQQLTGRLDVGASAGVMGVAGALSVRLPRRWRRPGMLVLAGSMVVTLRVSHQVWDFSHLAAVLLGMYLGRGRWVAWGAAVPLSLRLPAPVRKVLSRPASVRMLLATLLAASGAFNILGALNSEVSEHVTPWNDPVGYALFHGTRSFIVVTGIGLLLLARGVWRGRRVAWVLAVWLQLTSVAVSVVRDVHPVLLTLQLLLAGWLLARQAEFRARPDAPSILGTLRLLLAAFLVLVLYAAAGFLLLRHSFVGGVTPGAAVREFLSRLVLGVGSILVPARPEGYWFLDSISIIWVAVLLLVFVLLLRPVLYPEPESARHRERAMELLREWGGTSFAYMTTWPGNTPMLNARGDAYVAYRVVGGVALVLGDPVGTPDGTPRAAQEFLDLCERSGWVPCFFAVTSRWLDEYARLGLNALQIAENTVIDLEGLEFRGKDWQDVRTAMNRAERTGVGYQLYSEADVPGPLIDQLREISCEWAEEKGLPEMGFTLGTLSGDPDPSVRLCTAVDSAGTAHGFATWLPMYEHRRIVGWTIDMMRRRPGGFPNTIDFLIARSALAFRSEGASCISLSSAPLARVDRDGTEAGMLQRALDFLADRLEPYYGFRSLLAFKRKFKPRWEPVYLVFPRVTELPRISYAILRAYLPDLGLREVRDLLGDVVRPAVRR